MKESKGINVTSSQIKVTARKGPQYQLYHSRVRAGRAREPCALTHDVGVQFDTRAEAGGYRNCLRPTKYEQKRYPARPAWGARRSTLDVGVGSVKALPRRRVRRVYAARTADTAAGSGDLASLLNLSLRPKCRYRPRRRESREARGGGGGGGSGGRDTAWELLRTSSKCVGGPRASAAALSVSAKLSPIVQTRSGATSPIANQNDSKDSRGTETERAAGAGAVTAQGSAAGAAGAGAGGSGLGKNQVSSTMKNQKQSKQSLTQAYKPTYKPTTKRKNKTKETSSDSLLQKVHDFEESQNEEENDDVIIENELEREYRKIFDVQSVPKPPEQEGQLIKKSTSLFKRKFSALRKTVTKKESPQTTEAPSMKDASVTSDPPSLESRSFTSDRTASGQRRRRSHFAAAYKHSTHRNASKNWSRNPMSVDSEYGQGVKGMFKLWGKKFNFEEPAPRKETPYPADPKSSTNNSPKSSFESKPTERGESVPVKQLAGDAPSVVESKQCKPKSNKRFFFFKRKPSKDTKSQPAAVPAPAPAPAAPAPAYKVKKEAVTTNRCEVSEGLTLQLRPKTPLADAQRRKSVHKNKSIKSIEKYEEMLKAAWLMKFLTAPIESRNSVRVRWNNGMYYASSSSTVFELMEDVYQGNRFVLSQSEYTSQSTAISSHYNHSRARFLQAFHAYMMPRMIHHNRLTVPNKSSNNIVTLSRNKPDDSEVEVTVSDQKWYIEKSKAFSNNIEVVLHKLHSHNVVALRDPEASYLRINIPKGFFSERASEGPPRCASHLTSDEEVYKIVEYESDGARSRHRPPKVKSKVSNSGDFETEDSRVEQYKKTTIENLRVTISVQSERRDSAAHDTVIKRPPTRRDVLTQGSHVYVPRPGVGVGVSTVGVGRVSTDAVRDGPLSLQFIEYDVEEANVKRKKKGTHNCGFAKSFLRSEYTRWVPSSLALFARHASDSHVACRASRSGRSSACARAAPAARSCPNVPEEYDCDRLSAHSCSTPDRDWKPQGMYKCNDSYDSRAGNEEGGPARLLPRDSCKVFRTRKCRTDGGDSGPVKDGPYSVPSEHSTGVQAHPCGSARRPGVVSFVCEEHCDQAAEPPGSPSGGAAHIDGFDSPTSEEKISKQSCRSSSSDDSAEKLSQDANDPGRFLSPSLLLLEASSVDQSEETPDSAPLLTPKLSSTSTSQVGSAAESPVCAESRSREAPSSGDPERSNSGSFQLKEITLDSLTKSSGSDESPYLRAKPGEETPPHQHRACKRSLLQTWISPLMKSKHSLELCTKALPSSCLEPSSNIDVEYTIASSIESGGHHSCNCTPGTSTSSEGGGPGGPGRASHGDLAADPTDDVFQPHIKIEIKSVENSIVPDSVDVYDSAYMIRKTTDDTVLNEGVSISVGKNTSNIYLRPKPERCARHEDDEPCDRPCPPAAPRARCQEPVGFNLKTAPKRSRKCVAISPEPAAAKCKPIPSTRTDSGKCAAATPKTPPNSRRPTEPKARCEDPRHVGGDPKPFKCPRAASASNTSLFGDSVRSDSNLKNNRIRIFAPKLKPKSNACEQSGKAAGKQASKLMAKLPLCAKRNIGRLVRPEPRPPAAQAAQGAQAGCVRRGPCPSTDRQQQTPKGSIPNLRRELRSTCPRSTKIPQACSTCNSAYEVTGPGHWTRSNTQDINYESRRDPLQYGRDEEPPYAPPGPPDRPQHSPGAADFAFDDSCRVAVSREADAPAGFQYGDRPLSVESYNYLNGLTETAPLIENLYKSSKVEQITTNVCKKQENVDSNSSGASSSNVIEINVNLRLKHGDKTTEIKIDNENETRFTSNTKKSVDDVTNNVYLMNNSGQRKNHLKESNPDDLNIRILIKNQKPGKRAKSKGLAGGTGADAAAKRYSSVSTEHCAALQDAIVDAHFSVQRITVGVMQSFHQTHLVRCDKALSSVILMCSKSLLAVKSSILKGMGSAGGAAPAADSSFDATDTFFRKSVPAMPAPVPAHAQAAADAGLHGCSSQSLHLTRSSPAVSAAHASSTQRSILIKPSKSEKSSNSDRYSKSEELTTTEKTSKGGYEDERGREVRKRIHKSTKRISFTDTDLSDNPDLSLRTTTTNRTTDELIDSKSDDTRDTPGDGGSDALVKSSDDESVMLEEIPSAEVTAKTFKEERKEMLKQVFEDGLYLKKPKSKKRIQKMKDLLQAILTDDSDPEPLKKYGSGCVHHACKTDSMNNLYEEFDVAVPRSSREDAADPVRSARSINPEPNKSKKCYCKQFSTKLMLSGKGCSCCKTVENSDKEVTCNVSSLFAFAGLDGLSYWIPSVECVHVQTVNSGDGGSLDDARPPPGDEPLLVDKSAEVDEQTDELTEEQIEEQLEERESYSSKRFIKEVTHIDVPDSHTASGAGGRRAGRGGGGGGSSGAEVLQLYETKKAVLEIYAEKTVSQQGEHFVAKLPKFVHSAEGRLYKSVDWSHVFGPEVLS